MFKILQKAFTFFFLVTVTSALISALHSTFENSKENENISNQLSACESHIVQLEEYIDNLNENLNSAAQLICQYDKGIACIPDKPRNGNEWLYHTIDCPLLVGNYVMSSVEEAEGYDFTSCSLCHSDNLRNFLPDDLSVSKDSKHTYSSSIKCFSATKTIVDIADSMFETTEHNSAFKPFTAEDINKMLKNYNFSNNTQNSYIKSDSSATTNSYTVYVTPTGSKYHTLYCSYIKDRCRAIDLQTAIYQGYTACSRCF